MKENIVEKQDGQIESSSQNDLQESREAALEATIIGLFRLMIINFLEGQEEVFQQSSPLLHNMMNERGVDGGLIFSLPGKESGILEEALARQSGMIEELLGKPVEKVIIHRQGSQPTVSIEFSGADNQLAA